MSLLMAWTSDVLDVLLAPRKTMLFLPRSSLAACVSLRIRSLLLREENRLASPKTKPSIALILGHGATLQSLCSTQVIGPNRGSSCDQRTSGNSIWIARGRQKAQARAQPRGSSRAQIKKNTQQECGGIYTCGTFASTGDAYRNSD